LHRSDPVQRRLDGADTAGDDSRERLAGGASCAFGIREQHRRSTVIQWRRVACGDGAIRPKSRFQCTERLDRRVGSNALVSA
jgi:hypothetical protein